MYIYIYIHTHTYIDLYHIIHTVFDQQCTRQQAHRKRFTRFTICNSERIPPILPTELYQPWLSCGHPTAFSWRTCHVSKALTVLRWLTRDLLKLFFSEASKPCSFSSICFHMFPTEIFSSNVAGGTVRPTGDHQDLGEIQGVGAGIPRCIIYGHCFNLYKGPNPKRFPNQKGARTLNEKKVDLWICLLSTCAYRIPVP